MKNLLIALNVVLLVGLIVLYVLFFSGNKTTGKQTTASRSLSDSSAVTGMLPIAYVNTDSLLEKYTFAKDEEEKLLKKRENSQLTLRERYRKLENEIIDHQKKLQNSVYQTLERAQAVEMGLRKQQEDLEKLEARLSEDIMKENQRVSKQLKDSLDLVLKLYNEDAKYQLILSNSSMINTVLYAEEGYDITDEVLEMMNARMAVKEEK